MQQENSSKPINRWVGIVAASAGLPWFELIGELWKLGRKIMRGLSNEGIYEVLEYETTLELHDHQGEKATVNKRQKVRYLQDNIIAYQDQAWGDGEILIDYKCSPGEPADQYQFDHKTIILISLREIKNKGDVDEFHITWRIKNGFVTETESWATYIQHRTKRLKVKIIFPENRPPLRATLIESNRRRSHALKEKAKQQLPDGRWQIKWEKENPKLFENYLIEWQW
ncbi:MAG: hypothetical protein IH859_03385 [Chloroflexi bacterium]|nr:hypothetical protein [Chloroflexota bacterium]